MKRAWQPIETAPKDQRVLLRYSGGRVVCGSWDNDRQAKNPRPFWANDLMNAYGIKHTRNVQPTYWQPIEWPDAGWCVDELREVTHWETLRPAGSIDT